MLTQCGSIFCIYIFLNVYSVSFIFNYLCTYVLKNVVKLHIKFHTIFNISSILEIKTCSGNVLKMMISATSSTLSLTYF